MTQALRAVRANWPFALVCLGVLVGLAVVVLLDRFRRGTLVMAGAVLLGAWLRVLLPEEQLGLLRVRGRAFDASPVGPSPASTARESRVNMTASTTPIAA